MTLLIFETIIEFSAAIRKVYAQLLLMNRRFTSTYIMLIWMLLWHPLTYLFPRGTRVLVLLLIIIIILHTSTFWSDYKGYRAEICTGCIKLNSKNGFSNFSDSTSGSGNIRIIREIAYTAISLKPIIRLEWKLMLWKEETKASFLYDMWKDKQLPVPVVFVQYKNAPKASYL